MHTTKTLLQKAKPLDKYARFVPTHATFPLGFETASISAGIKKNNALDLGVIRNVNDPKRARAAAVFTTNKFQAAPVTVSRNVLQHTKGEGVIATIVNSGCANSVTGDQGQEDAEKTVDLVSKHLGSDSSENLSLVMSTGVIGQRLPMDKLENGIEKIFNDKKAFGSDFNSWLNFAKSICTTDTFPKIISKQFKLSTTGQTYTITGIAKGAGMICPNMATLLSYLITDLPLSSSAATSSLKYAVDRSFNCISVDGDMSTNDTLCMLSNGAIDNQMEDITEDSELYDEIKLNITSVAQDLAKLVVRDGEGSTKFVTVKVINSENYADARTIAESISNSMLVKTALYGQDANWGRILCAIGYAKLNDMRALDADKISVSFVTTDNSEPKELKLVINGVPQLNLDEERASQMLALEDLEVLVDLNTGTETAQFWTCDLTHEYVTINGDYRT
ncbi:hypothetical protein TBLA_0C00780 [Henningerozyma blattae CBS 6284]|uniref:Arginine biosynthesis bifunctional protein ArgJ, mitochondrial n=1 Tax=Henningerozyma blattae (strain ATCC 34711 / CBS 6284 / DSM 70876 / NBRC 10599 / NRRL Y-10934 / UCD 77-7) TaxID=1071380 RepID=I2H0J2_HENB6|nr:hypothetical protein TBLA_0C00780 [Tetrapisispora blattae CBS 6284]CCH59894.1 hypothetical protein TBLA_0C00780 [Tetrapisispora blattae CBS 6284]